MSRDAEKEPLYLRVEREIVEKIARGDLAVGELLPTEAELREAYGVSRDTIRKALRRIHDLGMIERRTAAGTRVVSTRPVSGYEGVVQSPDDIVALVADTRIRVAWSGEVKADRALARRLRCRVGREWFCLSGPRVPRGGSTALCWSDQYLAPGLNREALVKGNFEAEDMRGQQIEQEITAELLDETRATALEAEPGSAALVVTRRHFRGRTALSVGVHFHPADRYSIRSFVNGRSPQSPEG